MKAPESGHEYTFEFTYKVTGLTKTITVYADNREDAKKQALYRVFAIALDCELDLIDTDEPGEEPDYSLSEKLDERFV